MLKSAFLPRALQVSQINQVTPIEYFNPILFCVIVRQYVTHIIQYGLTLPTTLLRGINEFRPKSSDFLVLVY